MEALKELVFEPAGIMSTCSTGDRDRANVAIGKSTNGPTRSALEHPDSGFYGFQYKGMGGAQARSPRRLVMGTRMFGKRLLLGFL